MFLYRLIRGFRGSVSEKRKSEAERWSGSADARGGRVAEGGPIEDGGNGVLEG